MNITKLSRLAWIVGGVILATVVDLVYMFWSRSASGGRFNRAIWNSGSMGRGHFDIMGATKHLAGKGKYGQTH